MNDFIKKRTGELAVIIAGITWGCLSIFVKKLSALGFTNTQIIFLRLITAEIFLGIYLLIKDRKALQIDIKDLWIFAGGGIFSLTGTCLCYFRTIISCGASVGVVLMYTSPMFVVLMSAVLFAEKITSRKILAILAIFGGCILLSGLAGNSSSRISVPDFFIGLGSGVCYASYSVFSKYGSKKYGALTVVFYFLLFAVLSLFPFGFSVNSFRTLCSDTESIICVLCIGTLCTFVPYTLYTFSLEKITPGKAAILATVEPVVGTLIGVLLFCEQFSPSKIAGIAVILTGFILAR